MFWVFFTKDVYYEIVQQSLKLKVVFEFISIHLAL